MPAIGEMLLQGLGVVAVPVLIFIARLLWRLDGSIRELNQYLFGKTGSNGLAGRLEDVEDTIESHGERLTRTETQIEERA